MPTDNPKISSYVPQQIYDRFKEYQKEQNITMSQAMIVILAEYFGIEETLKEINSSSPIGGVTLSAFQELQERLIKVELEVEKLKATKHKDNKEEVDIKVDKYKSTKIKEITKTEQIQKDLFSFKNNKEKDNNIEIKLNTTQLAKHLGVSQASVSRVRKEKSTEEFTEWTQSKDIDHIAWEFLEEGKKAYFYPVVSTERELLSRLLTKFSKD